ncbi:MAG: SusD/RagB family nutrient-binding outer membrane lipoprotein, partial [Cytophagaceae bacterium]
MRKKLIALTLLIGSAQLSCTDNFDAINTDPTRASSAIFDPNLLLPSIQYNHVNATSGYNGPILFQAGWVQILASTSSGGANYYTNADKYVASGNTNSYVQSSWNEGYRSMSLADEIIKVRGGDQAWANITAVATIMKVLSMQYITDTYGDAPYSEALQAQAGITLPKYDRQEDIYKAMLADLEGALNAMDPAKAKQTADISSLGGDVAKWKRFGYSLMLRLAMRLVKQNPNLAQTWALKGRWSGVAASLLIPPAEYLFLALIRTEKFPDPKLPHMASKLSLPGAAIAAAGMHSDIQRINIISHNLANALTPAYKRILL